MYKLVILLLLAVMLYSCKNDTQSPTNQNSSNPYSSKWLLTITTDVSSSDTVTVDNNGNFSSDSIILHNPYINYISKFSGNIDSSGNFIASITYKNINFQYTTVINGNVVSDSVKSNLSYNNIIIGNARGAIHGNSASGIFSSPLFSGIWSVVKLQ